MQQNAEFFRMPSQTPFFDKKRKGILRLIAHIYAASHQRKEKKHRQTYSTPNLVYIYASITGYVLKLTEAYALPLSYLVTSP